jgi:LAS superfamily LD-carboxypeptidase LdcB
MLKNADDFGFSWEVQSEPWHLRYVAGDKVPAAVLAWKQTAI